MPFADEVKKVEQSGNFPLYLKLFGFAALAIAAATAHGWFETAVILTGGAVVAAALAIERLRK